MAYRIEFTPTAQRQISSLEAHARKTVIETIADQLRHQPGVETRNRKLLRPNDLARWELRIGSYRVFYNIEEEVIVVLVVALGEKAGNKLVIDGDEYKI